MKRLFGVLLAMMLSGCAAGGASRVVEFETIALKDDMWRVSYTAGDYASQESAQSRWLYRCAQLALEQGYDGFEIVSALPLTNVDLDASPLLGYQAPQAQSFHPVYLATQNVSMTADIRLLRQAIDVTPPRTFDARELKRDLEEIVRPQQTAHLSDH